MSLAEQFRADPSGLAAAIIVWVPVTVWVIGIIGWMVEGEVEIGIGLALLAIGLGLGILTVDPPWPRTAPWFASTATVCVLFFSKFRDWLWRRRLEVIELDQAVQLCNQAAERPGDAWYRFRVSEILYRKGHVNLAISMAESALLHMPSGIFDAEHKSFALWTRPDSGGGATNLQCMDCGTWVAPGAIVCPNCHENAVLALLQGRWIGRRPLFSSLCALAALIAGCAAIFVISQTQGMSAFARVTVISLLALATCALALRQLAVALR